MLQYVRMVIQSRIRSERGASAVEYGLLVALIAVAIVVAVTALGDSLSGMFKNACSEIDSSATC